MIDEGFHLTPVDVRRFDFGQKFRGCDPDRVEEFRNQVALELERLARINLDLEAKAKGFHEQLRAFRERDKALNDALVSAQQLRSEIRDQAEREGQLVLREAQMQAEQMVHGARSQISALQAEVVALEKSRRAYLAQFRAMIERQLGDLTAIEGYGLNAVLEAVAPTNPASSALPLQTRSHLAASGAERQPSRSPPAAPPAARGTHREAVEAELLEVLKTPAWIETFAQDK